MYANEKLMRLVWDGIIRTIDCYNRGIALPSSKLVRQAIDNSDIDLARQILAKYNITI